MSGDLKVTGFEGLEATLAELPNELAGKILIPATTAGARVILAEARRLAPVGKIGPVQEGEHMPGNLKRSLVARVRRRGVETGVTVSIGPTKRAWYAAIVEFGQSAHTIVVKGKKALADGGVFFGRKVNHPGSPPRPFLRPALDTRGQEAIDVLGKRAWAGIAKFAAGRRGSR